VYIVQSSVYFPRFSINNPHTAKPFSSSAWLAIFWPSLCASIGLVQSTLSHSLHHFAMLDDYLQTYLPVSILRNCDIYHYMSDQEILR